MSYFLILRDGGECQTRWGKTDEKSSMSARKISFSFVIVYKENMIDKKIGDTVIECYENVDPILCWQMSSVELLIVEFVF